MENGERKRLIALAVLVVITVCVYWALQTPSKNPALAVVDPPVGTSTSQAPDLAEPLVPTASKREEEPSDVQTVTEGGGTTEYISLVGRGPQPYVLCFPVGHPKRPSRREAGKVGGDDSELYPLILFLHGAGESGTDPTLILTAMGAGGTLPQLCEGGSSVLGRYVILSPQTAEGWRSTEVQQRVMQLVDDVAAISEYRIDRKQVHITGVSMGGNGALEFAARFPSAFVSVSSVCGYSHNAAQLCRTLAEHHLRLFLAHGANDIVVPVKESDEVFEECKHQHVSLVFERYPFAEAADGDALGVGHGSWKIAYSSREFWGWLAHR